MTLRSLARDTRSWALAARPVTLSAAAVPVLTGTALAARVVEMRWPLFALALVGALLIQVGTNLADEYTDHRRTAGASKFPAPHKVIQRGLLSERAVLLGMAVCFALSTGMGLYIVSQVGLPILVVGVFSLLAGYLYSSGPFPLGAWALGEVTVFFFMGPLIVMSSYYVQASALAWPPLWASVPVGLMVTAILQGNNLRDMEEDRAERKHTLASISGPQAARWTYAALLLGSYAVLATEAATGLLPRLALVALVPLPWAVLLVRRLWRATERPAFNAVLVSTATVHLGTGLLLALGIALDAAARR